MKISLVIPVHNLERYIEPLLVSLKYQNFYHDAVEPIFICDACSDRTHEIIETTLRDSYKHLVILDRDYHSSGLSRNDGLSIATGEYIWLLDGDDWLIDNHAISKVIAFFIEHPDDYVLQIGWLSNTFTKQSYFHTVWQWVWRSEWAKTVKFSSQKYDDDVKWVTDMLTKYEIYLAPKLEDQLYFYNYMREGSVMYMRKFENYYTGGNV